MSLLALQSQPLVQPEPLPLLLQPKPWILPKLSLLVQLPQYLRRPGQPPRPRRRFFFTEGHLEPRESDGTNLRLLTSCPHLRSLDGLMIARRSAAVIGKIVITLPFEHSYLFNQLLCNRCHFFVGFWQRFLGPFSLFSALCCLGFSSCNSLSHRICFDDNMLSIVWKSIGSYSTKTEVKVERVVIEPSRSATAVLSSTSFRPQQSALLRRESQPLPAYPILCQFFSRFFCLRRFFPELAR